MTFPARIIPELTPEDAAKFWGKVESTNPGECWRWMGHHIGTGYGAFSIRGKAYPAHRVAFIIAGGELGGMDTIDHLCLTKDCVNVAHFDVCSLRENQRRAWAVQYWTHYNHRKTHCKRGHEFTPANIRWIGPADARRRACRTCIAAYRKATRLGLTVDDYLAESA
jgi:hypothetical protein